MQGAQHDKKCYLAFCGSKTRTPCALSSMTTEEPSLTSDLRPWRATCHWREYFQEEQIIQRWNLLSKG